jgi:protein with PEP-CTERM/exosortase system signal
MFLVTASPFFLRPAQAYTVTLEQVGFNVVANGSGAINLTGLGLFVPFAGQAEVNPSAGFIITGPVPSGYISGTALSDSSTYDNATFASLGVTPGTYVWSWGTGLPNQNFTLIISGAEVPDGGSTVSLLGFGLLGLAALRRTLGC